MTRVRWTTDAADDFERVCDYIAETSPGSAGRAAQVVIEGVASLLAFPNRGEAKRLRLPVRPKWGQDIQPGGVPVWTREAIAELRAAIRNERRERREAVG